MLVANKAARSEFELLLDEINETKEKLKQAENSFHNTTEPRLISSYIYEIKALDERYAYLLSKAREFK